MGGRGVLVYCADFWCGHSDAMNADRWPDEMRLSDVRAAFRLRQARRHSQGVAPSRSCACADRIRRFHCLPKLGKPPFEDLLFGNYPCGENLIDVCVEGPQLIDGHVLKLLSLHDFHPAPPKFGSVDAGSQPIAGRSNVTGQVFFDVGRFIRTLAEVILSKTPLLRRALSYSALAA